MAGQWSDWTAMQLNSYHISYHFHIANRPGTTNPMHIFLQPNRIQKLETIYDRIRNDFKLMPDSLSLSLYRSN